MENLKAKVAYLQGLSEGFDLQKDSKEVKLIQGIIDALDDFAKAISDLHKDQHQMENYMETIDEDLYHLENQFYEGKMEGTGRPGEYLERECAGCGEIVCFDASVLDDEDVVEITCPNCDEVVFINDDRYETADEPEILENHQQTREKQHN